MGKLSLTVIILFIAIPALCDGTGTLVQWPGWCVTSTEALYRGHKHTSFPLTYMFDNNPATAWVFSGTGKHSQDEKTGYAIEINTNPVKMDSVRIMNGYNKSRALFLRNNRIVELKLYVNDKFLKTVSLTDCMGWHKISIPRQRVSEVELRFTKFVKGRDDDICVSEIALYDRGRKIDFKMPNVVEFTEGTEADSPDQGYEIIDRTGKPLVYYDVFSSCTWSPSHRYVAVADDHVWVVDATRAKLIMLRALSSDNSPADVVTWKGDHSIAVDIDTEVPNEKAQFGYTDVHHIRTFRIPG